MKIYKWSKLRVKALKRAGYKCEGCGSKDKLVVHHIDPIEGDLFGKKYFRNSKNRMDNVQVLCQSCHGKVHAENYDRAKPKDYGKVTKEFYIKDIQYGNQELTCDSFILGLIKKAMVKD